MLGDGQDFRDASPFPHAVIDGLWDPERLKLIAKEFPAASDGRWTQYADPKERGKRCGGAELWGAETAEWFTFMRSPEFTADVEAFTGLKSLTADTLGGGMHMTSEGGRLASHVDFNIHPRDATLERRINFLVFLNEGWDPAWGGCLLLGKNRDVEVVPEFNRTVIFETSEISWHGHPDPIVGDHLRKSLACYFYAPRRVEAAPSHSTVWM